MVRKLFFISGILILIFSAQFQAQSISVFAATDTTEYIVGDYIHYTLEVIYDKEITTEMPSLKDTISVLEFIKEYPVEREEKDSEVKELYHVVYSKYDSAGVTIPSIPIKYFVAGDENPREIKTNEVEIVVRTLEVNPQGDIQDVKAPIKYPVDWLFWLIIVLIILLVLIGLYFLYGYYKKKRAGTEVQKVVVKIPPHKIALKHLSELEEKKLWQQGKVKDYHSEVTGIIRQYFEERFNFYALEMTSTEVLDKLKNVKEAQSIFDKTRDFLSNADLVKFAKFQPLPSVNEEMMKQANEIVRQTIPMESQLLEEENVNA
ncbi:MAG: hypothetical protein HND52_02830 [Ignavibacteriae bacterium]|nr:hypothetical protein [Ignavibacteriota bacterium]NOG96886.1 hypothetical protein [Ignavibacteriota bacterium]